MSSLILSDIRDATASVRTVLSKAEDVWMNYQIFDGQLRVMNRHMRAGIPVMFDGDIVVPAEAFDKMLRTMRQDPEVLIGPKNIVFKSGKARLTLPQLTNEALQKIEVEDIEGDPIDLDEKFLEIIRLIAPLIEDSDNPDWQNSIICIDGRIISTYRGQILVSAHYQPFEDAKVRCLLPVDLIKFLLAKKTHPDEMILTKTAVRLQYPDDSWVHSSLVSGNVPKRLFDLLNEIGAPEWEVTDDHRDAIKDISNMGGSTVVFDKSGAWTELSNGRFDTGVEFPTGEGGTGKWNVRHLLLAMSLGQKFDFARYPKPATFVGEVASGIMAPMMI